MNIFVSTPRATRIIPLELRRDQIDASNPVASAWVAANAGSGKTHVLAQRVIRLLLDNVDPAKILCITFTKAAAANMANRVFDELRRWTALDEAGSTRPFAACRMSHQTLPCARAHGGFCLSPGGPRRAQGANHPRFLHAIAAPIPVRGQCRGPV